MEGPAAVKDALERIYSWALRTNQIDFKSPIQMLGICWDDMDLIPLSKFIYDAGRYKAKRADQTRTVDEPYSRSCRQVCRHGI